MIVSSLPAPIAGVGEDSDRVERRRQLYRDLFTYVYGHNGIERVPMSARFAEVARVLGMPDALSTEDIERQFWRRWVRLSQWQNGPCTQLSVQQQVMLLGLLTILAWVGGQLLDELGDVAAKHNPYYVAFGGLKKKFGLTRKRSYRDLNPELFEKAIMDSLDRLVTVRCRLQDRGAVPIR